MIHVQIVDDHKMLAQGLEKMINESGIAKVTHTFFTLSECRNVLAFYQPDVLLLDIHLPDGNGIDFCAEIKSRYPDVKVLAFTSHTELSLAKRILGNGASGFIFKNAACEEVIEGIETVYNGNAFLCEELVALMKTQPRRGKWLTSRECELLKLITEGYTNLEIAKKIYLSPETIKGYRKNLLQKLGAKNTAAMVRIALDQKLV